MIVLNVQVALFELCFEQSWKAGIAAKNVRNFGRKIRKGVGAAALT